MNEMRKLMESINTIAESWDDERVSVSEFKGKIFVDIEVSNGKDQINFKTADGETYEMYHVGDCCESVYLEDIVGELRDLIGTPMLEAEEVINRDENPPERFKNDPDDDYYTSEYNVESYTWTFYKLGTIKGHVTLRWYGTSNGYYSERVSVFRKDNGDNEL